jgi:hypothetical protein
MFFKQSPMFGLTKIDFEIAGLRRAVPKCFPGAFRFMIPGDGTAAEKPDSDVD